MTREEKEAAMNRYLEERYRDDGSAPAEQRPAAQPPVPKRPMTPQLIPYSNPKMKYYCLIGLLVIAVVAYVIVDAVRRKDLLKVNYGYYMGTVVIENIYGEKDHQPVFDGISHILETTDDRLSLTAEDSSVSRLNRTHAEDFGEDAERLFAPMIKLYQDTEGKFDLTVGSLSTLWAIGTDHARVPEEDEIEEGLRLTDGSLLTLDGSTVMTGPGQIVDLGAVGKGYACDLIRDYLAENEIHGACISVGGTVLLYGQHGKDPFYTVGIRDPEGEASDTIATLSLSDCCVSTSGNYEKTFESYHIIYHHIMDTETGYPVENDLVSVTVMAGSGLLSDALSTACFSLGLEDGMKLLEKYGADGVFIDASHNVYVTPGTEIEITDKAYRLPGDT